MYQKRSRLSLFLSTLLITLTAILAGCGDGGSSIGNTDISSARTGVAVDPYIVGAVFEEIPAHGGSAIQESTPSDERGEFVFALPLTQGSTLRMKEGAQGVHNGLAYGSILKRIVEGEDAQVVSPLTTLLANGMSAEEVLSVLSDAGLPGLQIADLHADPMARMETAAVLNAEALLPLQANIAVNQLFTLAGNSDLEFEELTNRRDELAQMVEMTRSAVSRDSFDKILNSEHRDLVGNAGAIGRDHAIRAIVSIIDSVVAEKMADPAVNAVSDVAALLSESADLALIYFVKENRGNVSVEEGITAGVLPDVQEDDTVYLELAKWKWKSSPVADAGSDQSVSTGDLVTLDGARSTDPDHKDDSLAYQWSFSSKPQGSAATLNGATTVNPTFTADVDGDYRISLIVFDNWGGASAPSTVTVTAAGSALSAPGVIQFDSATYSAGKGDGRVNIVIERIYGSTGSVTVEWRTLSDTATDQDFAGFTWTPLTFAAGETRKEVSVDIIDNNSSGDKTFSVQLGSPNGGAVLGSPDSAVVTILDDGKAIDDGIGSDQNSGSEVFYGYSRNVGANDNPAAAPHGGVARYVAWPSGNNSGSGTINQPWKDLGYALRTAGPGDTIYLRGGVHSYGVTVNNNVNSTQSRPIEVRSYPGEWAIIDGSNLPSGHGNLIRLINVQYLIFKNLEIRKSDRSKTSSGIYAENLRDSQFHNIYLNSNNGSGFSGKGIVRNKFYNCTSANNVDIQQSGKSADGFSNTDGSNNEYYRCVAYGNSDDGFDFWATSGNYLEDCVSANNGVNQGNGNGFKLGKVRSVSPNPNMPGGNHKLVRCIAANNKFRGFSDNGTDTGSSYTDSISYGNSRNWWLPDSSGNYILRGLSSSGSSTDSIRSNATIIDSTGGNVFPGTISAGYWESVHFSNLNSTTPGQRYFHKK